MFTFNVKIDEPSLRKELRLVQQEVLKVLADRGQELFEDDVMGTWENKYPVSQQAIGLNERDIVVTGDIFFYLNDGTDIRYAKMTTDFVPKTDVNELVSEAGQGGFSHLTFPFANPGIEARNFDQSVARQLEKEAPTILD